MIKSNLDNRLQEPGLVARLGRGGGRRFAAVLTAVGLAVFLFSSCFTTNREGLSNSSTRIQLVALRQGLAKLVEKGYDPASTRELLEAALKIAPGIAEVKVYVDDKLDLATAEGLAATGKEQDFLKNLEGLHRTGSAVAFPVYAKGGITRQAWFTPIGMDKTRYVSATVVFREARTGTLLVPALVGFLAVALVVAGAFFWLLLGRGPAGAEKQLRWFLIGSTLLMVLVAHVVFSGQGNRTRAIENSLVNKGMEIAVAKGALGADDESAKSYANLCNRTPDNKVFLRFQAQDKDGGGYEAVEHLAYRGTTSLLSLIFFIVVGFVSLPLSFGAYAIVDKKLAGLKTFLAYLFIVLFILICIVPILWMAVASFFSKFDVTSMITIVRDGEIFTKNYFRLDNYADLLKGSFLFYLRNSLFVATVTAMFSTVVGIGAGYAFSRFIFPGRRKQLMWVLITQLFPMAMMILPLYIVAQLLSMEKTLFIIVIAYSATALPFAIWMMKGYFDTIPLDIEEAAAIDGASTGQRLWHVLLPLARPAIATTFFYSFITAWNEFAIASFFLDEDKMRTLPVALRTILINGDYAGFSAAGVLASLPIVILFAYLQKHLVSGLMAGSVKG